MPSNTELDALLDRIREDKADPTSKNRQVVAYDCWRMFENLATRYKEEFAMRDRYKARSKAWMERALRQASLLDEIAALDDGDEPFAWKHEDLFNRIRAELGRSAGPTAELLSDVIDPMNGWRCSACGYWHRADVLSEGCPVKCEDCGLPFQALRGLGVGRCGVCSKTVSPTEPLCPECAQHPDAIGTHSP